LILEAATRLVHGYDLHVVELLFDFHFVYHIDVSRCWALVVFVL